MKRTHLSNFLLCVTWKEEKIAGHGSDSTKKCDILEVCLTLAMATQIPLFFRRLGLLCTYMRVFNMMTVLYLPRDMMIYDWYLCKLVHATRQAFFCFSHPTGVPVECTCVCVFPLRVFFPFFLVWIKKNAHAREWWVGIKKNVSTVA